MLDAQRGNNGRSTRRRICGTPERVAGRCAEYLVAYMKDHGFSERETCLMAEIDRRTFRRATGRPYPSDHQGVSFITLRDFVSVCRVLKLDAANVLAEIQKE